MKKMVKTAEDIYGHDGDPDDIREMWREVLSKSFVELHHLQKV